MEVIVKVLSTIIIVSRRVGKEDVHRRLCKVSNLAKYCNNQCNFKLLTL